MALAIWNAIRSATTRCRPETDARKHDLESDPRKREVIQGARIVQGPCRVKKTGILSIQKRIWQSVRIIKYN
jgi:hypothetical protein